MSYLFGHRENVSMMHLLISNEHGSWRLASSFEHLEVLFERNEFSLTDFFTVQRNFLTLGTVSHTNEWNAKCSLLLFLLCSANVIKCMTKCRYQWKKLEGMIKTFIDNCMSAFLPAKQEQRAPLPPKFCKIYHSNHSGICTQQSNWTVAHHAPRKWRPWGRS